MTVKYPADPPLLDIDMENQINLQRDIITDFKMSNRIKFDSFESDRGAKFSLVKQEEDDDIIRGIMCLRRAFKQNNYFQLTTSQFSMLIFPEYYRFQYYMYFTKNYINICPIIVMIY